MEGAHVLGADIASEGIWSPFSSKEYVNFYGKLRKAEFDLFVLKEQGK